MYYVSLRLMFGLLQRLTASKIMQHRAFICGFHKGGYAILSSSRSFKNTEPSSPVFAELPSGP